MVFQVKTDPPDPWVQEEHLVREDDQDFPGLLGLEVTTVLEAATASRAPLVLLELQDSLDLLVLRVKLDLQAPLVQAEPQEREENRDLRDMLVLRVLLAPLGLMAALAVKEKWVPPVFPELLG